MGSAVLGNAGARGARPFALNWNATLEQLWKMQFVYPHGRHDPGTRGRRAVADDPLPSWNEGLTKKAIVDFVVRVTTEGDPKFVPVAERIAAFDNDGTLWCEQPTYVQVAFAVDRIKVLSAEHPEWKQYVL